MKLCAGVFNLCAVKIKWNFKITKQNFPLKKEVFIYIRPSHSSVVSKEKTFVNGNLYTTAFKIRNKGEIPIFKDIFENKSMTKSQII